VFSLFGIHNSTKYLEEVKILTTVMKHSALRTEKLVTIKVDGALRTMQMLLGNIPMTNRNVRKITLQLLFIGGGPYYYEDANYACLNVTKLFDLLNIATVYCSGIDCGHWNQSTYRYIYLGCRYICLKARWETAKVITYLLNRRYGEHNVSVRHVDMFSYISSDCWGFYHNRVTARYNLNGSDNGV
jgi:hypothetical protein